MVALLNQCFRPLVTPGLNFKVSVDPMACVIRGMREMLVADWGGEGAMAPHLVKISHNKDGAKGGHIDFMFLAPRFTQPLDLLLNGILRFAAGATPADPLTFSIAALPF